MTERTELINDIEKLKAERNRLLRQVEEAEQWEGVAWDSFNALADHIQATKKSKSLLKTTGIVLEGILKVNLNSWLVKLFE